jgi:hypothetical protein
MARRLLDEPGVRRFVADRTVCEPGARITREGLPMVAMVAAHAGAQQLGPLAALSTRVGVLSASWAGVAADRRRRRPPIRHRRPGLAAAVRIPHAADRGQRIRRGRVGRGRDGRTGADGGAYTFPSPPPRIVSTKGRMRPDSSIGTIHFVDGAWPMLRRASRYCRAMVRSSMVRATS